MSSQGIESLSREHIIVASVVVLGSFMALLDTTIVNVAIPTLGDAFGATVSTIQWVVTGYLLALSIVVPLCGWAVQRWGAKPIWTGSVALFTLGSLLCAASWSDTSLIAFRCLQGAAGGMILPVGQAIVAQAAGPRRMGRMMAIIGAPTLLAPILGPVVGGLIVQYASWRLIFLVNVPIGLLAVVMASRVLKTTPRRAAARFDAVGFAALAAGSGFLVYGLARVGASSSVTQRQGVVPLAIGALCLVFFLLHARRRGAGAVLDMSMFSRSRDLRTAGLMALFFSASLLGVMLMLSIYYQSARGEGPLAAGALIAPQGAGAAVSMAVGGWLTDRFGAGRVVPGAVVLMLSGTAILTQVGSRPSFVVLALALAVRGLGLGSIMTPTMAAALSTLEHGDVPGATTALNIIQRIAGAVGTALLAVLLARGLSGSPAGVYPAGAFERPFWVAWAMLAVLLPLSLLLPRRPQGFERSGRGTDVEALT